MALRDLMKWVAVAVAGTALGMGTGCDDSCGAGFMKVGAACVAIVFDGGLELCNGMDDDADGAIDEADPSIGMACGMDEGACTTGTLECMGGELVCSGVAAADEICDGLDNDCDGEVDNGVLTTFYLDADEDDAGGEMECQACAASECGEGAWLETSTDCNDDCPGCFPGAPEVCDEADNDCDDSVDEEVTTSYYLDGDDDGFGVGEAVDACVRPDGYAEEDGDCADEDNRAFPGQTMFFAPPVVGDGVALRHDFDCDGEETQEHQSCGGPTSATCLRNGCYRSPAGFPADPECGERVQIQESATISVMGRDQCIPVGGDPLNGNVACR